jgi:hypothetical protein
MRAITRLLVLSLVLGSCSGPPSEETPAGSLSASLEASTVLHDVTAVKFDVVASDASCDATAVASKTVALETEPLPASLAGPGAGKHAFADGLFVLAPGAYKVCATPLAGMAPSADCARAEGAVTVVSSQTTEVVLVSQCRATSNGGADVVVSLNDPPQITAVVIDPSKFITVCESAKITATAVDPNGDTVSFGWSLLSGPGGTLTAAGASATFSTRAAGDYLVEVSASDGRGGKTSLSFPIHVSDATCAVPANVQALIDLRCSPCHTMAAAGGLSMANAETTFANLVGRNAVGAGCMDRIRVVRGESATSYIIAKLRNIAPICGMQMPRGRPPLVDEEIQVFEAWINGLPR